MSERATLMAWLLIFSASMACGRSKLREPCPLCNHDRRDASAQETSAGKDATAAAREAGGPDEPAANCGTVTKSTSRIPLDVLIVLDRSDWMALSSTEDTACLAGSACISRWQATRDLLKSALEGGAYYRWGLKLFPSPGAGLCSVEDGVEVALALDAPAAVEDAIDRSAPSGLAPMGDALRAAGAYLQGLTDGYPKFILLATSGVASCEIGDGGIDAAPPGWSVSEFDAVQAAGDVRHSGIPVYVLSSESPANARAFLDALAGAGGTTAHYSVNNPNAILGALFPPQEGGSCVMSLREAPPEPDKVAVTMNGEPVPRDPGNLEGWNFADPAAIVFYGSYCERLIQLNPMKVEIVFGCP